jgi:outer membrane receptor protein involved in Fe transport
MVLVVDANHRPLANTPVALTDPIGSVLRVESSDSAGRVTFGSVAPGRYELRATPAGAAPLHLPLTVTAALPMDVTIRVPAAVTDRVVVEATAINESSFHGSIAGDSIDHVPARVRGRALQDVVATLPGWSTEDNGLLHARGIDDGFLYVIDGVPVYERLDAVSGVSPDLNGVGSINVVTGYVPPEFGYKAGGVIEVRSAVPQSWTGHAEAGVGSDDGRDMSTAIGGRVGARVTMRAGVSAARSHRFLDPVHPDNLHNTGGQSSTFGQMDWAASGLDLVSATWGYGRSLFDVPNTEDQESAGQDQRQRLGQTFFSGSWQRTWSSDFVTHAALYHRRSGSRLTGSESDVPLEAHADRSLNRTGVLFAATRQRGSHLVKGGTEWQRLSLDEVFSFAITDEDEAIEAGFSDPVLAFTPDQPFHFSGDTRPTLFSAYIQDAWQATPRLTLNGGLRYDRSTLLLHRQQVSPRAGVALRLSDSTVVRGAVSRFFQPPQPENLLLSSSPEARVLSDITVDESVGGADVEPERQWSTEVGVEHATRVARLQVAFWARRLRDVADPNVFAGTTIIFPNAVAKGRAHGLEMRIEVPKARGWSGYANWSVGRVIQTGPVTGGLFLEDEIEDLDEGVEFFPDHDQRFTAAGGVTWEHERSGMTVATVARFETGTPIQREDEDLDELRELPGADMVDFERGRVKPRTVVSAVITMPLVSVQSVRGSLAIQITNLFDQHYAFNFGNPFSGTHFGAPRAVAVNARFAWR